MCFGKCDSPEGNLCRKCEGEMADVKAEALYDDGWWPMMQVRRSINNALADSPVLEESLAV